MVAKVLKVVVAIMIIVNGVNDLKEEDCNE